MIIGDSSASGVGAPHQRDAVSGQLVRALESSYTVEWRLVARSGVTTRAMVPLLSTQPKQPTDVVVVLLGVNDVTHQIPLKRVLRKRAILYQNIFEDWGAKRIIATGIPKVEDFPLLPQPLRWFLGLQARRYDAALSKQAKALGIDYVPLDTPLTPRMMSVDGFHPGPNTYHIMGEKIARHILHR